MPVIRKRKFPEHNVDTKVPAMLSISISIRTQIGERQSSVPLNMNVSTGVRLTGVCGTMKAHHTEHVCMYQTGMNE